MNVIKTMILSIISVCILGSMQVGAQELMDGINPNTTQVMMRLSGPWDSEETMDANQFVVAPGERDVFISDDEVSDWREDQPPLVVDAGQYLWAHVFLNIRSPQTNQVNTANPQISLPILYNLGDGRVFNIMQVANTPQLGVDYIGPASGDGYNAFPGSVALSKNSNTELVLDIERTGNVDESVYHVASIKVRIRSLLEGGDQTRVEITPAAWLITGRVDQPDRIADAVVKTPAPQFVFNTDVKRHLLELTNVETETNMQNETVTVTKSSTLGSSFFLDHLGWRPDRENFPIPTGLYPFPPYLVYFRDPLKNENLNAWKQSNYDEDYQIDVNGDGTNEIISVKTESIFNSESNSLTVMYKVSGPVALTDEMTDYVTNLNVRAIADFIIKDEELPRGILR